MSKQKPPEERRREGASWIDERALERGNMRVQQGFAKLRSDAAFDEAESCAACRSERRDSGDEDALCEAHLAQAMGMNSAW